MSAGISVVVVSWNTREALARCLDSVMHDPVGAMTELWVVDNGSSDGSPEMVRDLFPGARLIVNTANRGFAAACNQAMALVTSPVVVLLNSDASLEPGALAGLRRVLEERPDVGVVGGQVIDPHGRPQRSHGAIPHVSAFVAEMLGLGSLPLLGPLFPAVAARPRPRELAREVGYVSGACLAFRRELLDAIGPFDERFFLYFEETDFCLRARRDARQVVWFDPAIRIHHEGQTSAVQLGAAAEVHYARSAYAFVCKHQGSAAARRLAAAFRLWLAAQTAIHGLQALVGRPGAGEALVRKRRLMRLHRELGRSVPVWGWTG